MKKTPQNPPTRTRKENLEKAALLMLIARDYLGDVLHDDCIRKDMDACEAILPAAEGLCLVIDILQKEAFGIKKPSQKGKKKSQKKE